MTTDAFNTQGAQLKLEDSPGAGTYTAVAQVGDIDGPAQTVGDIDVTNHDSGGVYEGLPGLKDNGSLTFDVIWKEHATQTAVRAVFEAKTVANWQYVRTDSKQAAFAGFVTAMNAPSPADGNSALMMSVTIRVTGAVTWT